MSPCVIVMFGASGDLTRRKLVPALYNLARDGLLPEKFALIGNSREGISDDEFRKRMREALKTHIGETLDEKIVQQLLGRFLYVTGDSLAPQVYAEFQKRLGELKECWNEPLSVLFYLATPPQLFSQIPRLLSESGLLKEENGTFRRVVFEKPFGRDYQSARSLNEVLSRHLREDQIFRIDHYLGKETVQNIMAFRFANNTFEPLWNQHYIDSVQITVAETDGIESRGGYYDSAGALRDMVPNHLFQLVSLIGMEAPNSFDADDVRDEKVKVIQAIRRYTAESALRLAVRGQYGPARRSQRSMHAYRDEKKVSPLSETETFVAMKLEIDNWRWAGVPFFLRTGKRLAEHETQIVIQFRHVPVQMFRGLVGGSIEPNLLTIQIYPREEISLSLAAKLPGTVVRLGKGSMTFNYESAFGTSPRTGYETLIYDALMGDRTLFQRADQVEEAWQVLTPVLEAWSCCQTPDFPNYPSGSWGPPESQALLARDGHYWRELEYLRPAAHARRISKEPEEKAA